MLLSWHLECCLRKNNYFQVNFDSNVQTRCIRPYIDAYIVHVWILNLHCFVWLRFIDEGSIPGTSVWPLLLLQSNFKMCFIFFKADVSLFLYQIHDEDHCWWVTVTRGTCSQVLRFTLEGRRKLSIIWLDLANAYWSVPHKLIHAAMYSVIMFQQVNRLSNSTLKETKFDSLWKTIQQHGRDWRRG